MSARPGSVSFAPVTPTVTMREPSASVTCVSWKLAIASVCSSTVSVTFVALIDSSGPFATVSVTAPMLPVRVSAPAPSPSRTWLPGVPVLATTRSGLPSPSRSPTASAVVDSAAPPSMTTASSASGFSKPPHVVATPLFT